MLIFKASTPEELRQDIIKYLKITIDNVAAIEFKNGDNKRIQQGKLIMLDSLILDIKTAGLEK